MQRRLVNALEDLRVKYDYTVRNTTNTGTIPICEDSVDPTKSKFGRAIDVDSLIEDVTGGNNGKIRYDKGP